MLTGGTLSKRSLFSPLCTWWMLLWRLLLEYSLTKVAFGGTAANLRSLFRGRKFLKLLKGLMVGQAVPEIPLSVGSKFSELANFRIHPRTLTHLSAYVHVYCRVYLYVYMLYTMYINNYTCIYHSYQLSRFLLAAKTTLIPLSRTKSHIFISV